MRELPQSDSPVTIIFAVAFPLEAAVTGAARLALPAAWRMAAVWSHPSTASYAVKAFIEDSTRKAERHVPWERPHSSI